MGVVARCYTKGVGRREDALTTSTRALDTYQTLAEQRPGLFAHDLHRAIQFRELLRGSEED